MFVAEDVLRLCVRLSPFLLRAERGGGELLRTDPEFGKGKKCTTVGHLGLTRNDSSRWQAIARIPEDDFERHIAEYGFHRIRIAVQCDHEDHSHTEAP